MKPSTAKSLQNDRTGLRSEVGRAITDAKGALAGIGIFSAFINVLMLTGPLYLLQVYDRVLISASAPTLVTISILMVITFAFMGFLEFCRSRVLLRVADKVEKDLGGRTFEAWMKHGLVGKNQARMAPLNDVATIRQFLSGNAPGTFFDIPWVFIYIGVIYFLHWTLGVMATIGAIIILVMAIYNEISTRKPQSEAMKFRRAEQAFAAQSHRNTDAITAMGMAGNMRNKWQQMNYQGAEDAQRAGDRQANASSSTKAFRMMLQSGILGWGGYLAIQQIITPGTMIAGSIIMGRALAPVQMAIGQWRGFNAAREAFARLNKFYDYLPEQEDSLRLPEPTGQISVEHVFAGPPGAPRAVLADLNFSLEPGEGLGVIGPSAAGKSTSARLLVGLWEPEAIVEAAKMADVNEMILKFENGYDTRVGEGGAVLSGGQTQRIALARAIYGRPKLLVLDEPNSNLDTDGDAALSRVIQIMRKAGTTVIVMAHRPSAIAAVNKLLMLKDGRQMAFGPKDEVLKSVTQPVPSVQKAKQTQAAKQRQNKANIPQTTSGGPAMLLRKPDAS